jgi:hypothetical protein
MRMRLAWAVVALLWLLCAAGAQADVYMPVWAVAVADETDRTMFIRHSDDSGIGYRLKLSKLAGSNVHGIYSIEEGTLRKAWYAAYAPDASNTLTPLTSGNSKYNSFDNAADYADWNVPAAANGMDRLVLVVVTVGTGGEFEAVRNPAGTPETLGTISTVGAGTIYRVEKTITLASALAAGDVVRIRRPAAETATARLHGIYAYSSAAAPAATDAKTLTTAAAIKSASSAMEFAYSIAPTGSAKLFIGGYLHQGGAGNCIEVSPVEAWTLDGAAWAFAVGYSAGTHTLRRTSVVYYDAGNADIAHLDYAYTFAPTYASLTNQITATVALDTGSLYVGMFPAVTTTASVEIDGRQTVVIGGRSGISTGRRGKPQVLDASVTDDGSVDATPPNSSRVARFRTTPGGAIPVFELLAASHVLSRVFLNRHASYDKFYFEINPGSAAVIGETWGSTWRLRVGATPSPPATPVVIGNGPGLY